MVVHLSPDQLRGRCFESLDEMKEIVDAQRWGENKEVGWSLVKVCSRRVKIPPGVINIHELKGSKNGSVEYLYFIFADGEMYAQHRSVNIPHPSLYEECTFPLTWDQVSPGLDAYFDIHSDVPKFQVFVNTMTGKIITLWVNQHNTISELKELIQANDGTPPDEMRLIFAGCHLEDERTISDCKIQGFNTIQLVLRLRGGMYHLTSSRVDFASVGTSKKLLTHIKFGPEDTDEFELELTEDETRESLVERANETIAKIKDLEDQIRALKCAKKNNDSEESQSNRGH
jgi:hypothetical protein